MVAIETVFGSADPIKDTTCATREFVYKPWGKGFAVWEVDIMVRVVLMVLVCCVACVRALDFFSSFGGHPFDALGGRGDTEYYERLGYCPHTTRLVSSLLAPSVSHNSIYFPHFPPDLHRTRVRQPSSALTARWLCRATPTRVATPKTSSASTRPMR